MRAKRLQTLTQAGLALALASPLVSVSQELQEIVVTAQKREQSLQDVSAAVTAVGADRLATAQISNLEDLQTIVPTITFGNDFNMAKLFIRGVGANTSTTGSEPGVALHVDGAVIARAEAQLTSLFDLERIEVLRGPQGTLYGRNATGGSINLITAKPTDELKGYTRFSAGNYNAINIEAALGGPIAEAIQGRIAVKTQERDGFGINPVTGNDIDDLSREMVRGHLNFDIAENLDFLLTGEWFRQDDASGALKFRRESFIGVPRLAAPGIGGYARNPRDLASDVDPNTDTETWAFTGTFGWDINDIFSVTNISNFRDFETSVTQDLDTSSVVNNLAVNGQPSTIQRRDVTSKQYSNELQLNFNSPTVNGVLGLFYFVEHQKPTDTIDAERVRGLPSNLTVLANGPTIRDGVPNSAPIDPLTALSLCNSYKFTDIDPQNPIPPKRVCAHSELDTEAWALFGQTVIGLGRFVSSLETVSLKLGGRYSSETRESANPSLIIAAGGRGPVIYTSAAATYRKRDFSDFTPEGGLEWRATEDMLLYYTYSEGFKSGSGENAAGSTTIVGPEEITNHELGIKSQWLDGRLAVNASLYSYDLQGLQISKTFNDPVAGFVTRFENAADLSAKGAELEVAASATERLRFSASVAYLKSEFDDFLTADPLNPRNISTPPNLPPYDPVTNPTGFSPVIEQLAGNPTRNSPEWSGNLHAEFDIPAPGLPGAGMLTLSGDVSYKDEMYFTEFARLLEGSDDYTMLDATLRYRTDDEKFSVELWGRNLTDEFRPTSTFALATARTLGVTYLPPRTYGVTVGYNF